MPFSTPSTVTVGTVTTLAAGASATATNSGSNTAAVIDFGIPQGLAGSGPTLSSYLCSGRLTLTSGTPITTSDVTAATTLYLTPYNGNVIALYNGSTWDARTFSELSLSLAGFAANTNFDIYANWSGSAVVLSAVAWSSATLRSVAIATQDGVDVKTGALTFRLIGTIRTTATIGQTEDSKLKRFVSNRQNAIRRSIIVQEATANWNYNTATWRQVNGSTANQVGVVFCQLREMNARAVASALSNTATDKFATGIGIDSTTADSCQTRVFGYIPGNNMFHWASSEYEGTPGIGYHYIAWLEYTISTGLVTYGGTFAGAGLAAICQTGMVGWVEN